MEVVREERESEAPHPSWKIWKQRRYVLSILAFFGYLNAHALRNNLGVALVAMTENKTIVTEDGSLTYMQEFNWDFKIQGYILSSFFYGYMTTLILGGWLASRIGGKRVFGTGIAVTAVLTLLTPWAAKESFYLVMVLRTLEGVFEGVTTTTFLHICAKWFPPFERSLLVGIAISGSYTGTVIAMPISSYLSVNLGWESIFYVLGSAGLIWFCFWWYIVTDTPYQDPKISGAELKYINESLGYTNDIGPIKHPWKRMLLSVPVWAIFVAHFCDGWGYVTLTTQLPTFMKDVLHFELEHMGMMSAMPFICVAVAVPTAGYLADCFLKKRMLTTTQVRKIFNTIGLLGPPIFMLAASHSASSIVSLVCLCVGAGLGGFVWIGFGINYLDIGPLHASVLKGIGGTIAALSGIISPILNGHIVTTGSKFEWQIVFYIAAGVYLFGIIFYLSFARAELQPWAVVPQTPKTNVET